MADQPEATAMPVRIPLFGARKVAQHLQQELAQAQESLTRLGALEHAEIQRQIADERSRLDALRAECQAAEAQLAELRSRIVVTEEAEILQEVGVYEYRHPLSDAAAYQDALKGLQAEIKSMAKADGGAVTGATNWTVNGSLPQGRKMVRETCKLMLRAYNAEADNLVRSLKPYKLGAALERLDKAQRTLSDWVRR